jgi:hypothetical protein
VSGLQAKVSQTFLRRERRVLAHSDGGQALNFRSLLGVLRTLRAGHPWWPPTRMTRSSRPAPSLFYHFVGTEQDRLWHSETERGRGLNIDGHLEFDRQLNGKL